MVINTKFRPITEASSSLLLQRNHKTKIRNCRGKLSSSLSSCNNCRVFLRFRPGCIRCSCTVSNTGVYCNYVRRFLRYLHHKKPCQKKTSIVKSSSSSVGEKVPQPEISKPGIDTESVFTDPANQFLRENMFPDFQAKCAVLGITSQKELIERFQSLVNAQGLDYGRLQRAVSTTEGAMAASMGTSSSFERKVASRDCYPPDLIKPDPPPLKVPDNLWYARHIAYSRAVLMRSPISDDVRYALSYCMGLLPKRQPRYCVTALGREVIRLRPLQSSGMMQQDGIYTISGVELVCGRRRGLMYLFQTGQVQVIEDLDSPDAFDF